MKFILGKKCTILVSVIANEGGYACMWGSMWKIPVPPSQFCCKPKTAQKIVLKKLGGRRKNRHIFIEFAMSTFLFTTIGSLHLFLWI